MWSPSSQLSDSPRTEKTISAAIISSNERTAAIVHTLAFNRNLLFFSQGIISLLNELRGKINVCIEKPTFMDAALEFVLSRAAFSWPALSRLASKR